MRACLAALLAFSTPACAGQEMVGEWRVEVAATEINAILGPAVIREDGPISMIIECRRNQAPRLAIVDVGARSPAHSSVDVTIRRENGERRSFVFERVLVSYVARGTAAEDAMAFLPPGGRVEISVQSRTEQRVAIYDTAGADRVLALMRERCPAFGRR